MVNYKDLLKAEDQHFLDSILSKYLDANLNNTYVKPCVLLYAIRSKKSIEIQKKMLMNEITTEKVTQEKYIDRLENLSEEPMDFHLLMKVKKANYSIVGLDNKIGFKFYEELYLDTISIDEQVENLLYSLRNDLLEENIINGLNNPLMNSLKNAYYNQDMDSIKNILFYYIQKIHLQVNYRGNYYLNVTSNGWNIYLD